MAGMLQILTYLFSVYLIFKGFEILQIGLASNRENRTALIVIGALAVFISIVAAIGFSAMQDKQATSMSRSFD